MRQIIAETLSELERTGRFQQLKRYRQHGSCTVYDHSVNVAEASLRIADGLRLKLDRAALKCQYFDGYSAGPAGVRRNPT